MPNDVRRRPGSRSWLTLLIGATLVLTSLIAPAVASAAIVPDDDTLLATLVPAGDAGGSGDVVLDLDSDLLTACYEVDVTLTDLVGDPPTAIEIRDTTLTYPANLVLLLTTTVNGSGHAEGCVAADHDTIFALWEDPSDYEILVRTAGFATGAIRGGLTYTYPTALLDVATYVCPPEIQSASEITPTVAATCESILLPVDDITGTQPIGYTIVGYAGIGTFDYLVEDFKHASFAIARALLADTNEDCDAIALTCTYDLAYQWHGVAADDIQVTPTVFPTGLRFGKATATDGTDPLTVTVGAGNSLQVDITGVANAGMSVYLLQEPLDTTAPTVTKPVTRFLVGGTYGPTAPVRLLWSGSDLASGVDHYTLQRSLDGGAYTTIGSNLTTASANTTVLKDHTYRFRVQAFDEAGNPSAYAYGSIDVVKVTGDNGTSIDYSSSWRKVTSPSATGDSLHYSNAAGATARFTFRGQAIAWVAPIGPTRGSAQIFLDGKLMKTLNLNGTFAPRIVQYTATWSKVGTHTIVVKVVGTTGHPRIDVDAFMIID